MYTYRAYGGVASVDLLAGLPAGYLREAYGWQVPDEVGDDWELLSASFGEDRVLRTSWGEPVAEVAA